MGVTRPPPTIQHDQFNNGRTAWMLPFFEQPASKKANIDSSVVQFLPSKIAQRDGKLDRKWLRMGFRDYSDFTQFYKVLRIKLSNNDCSKLETEHWPDRTAQSKSFLPLAIATTPEGWQRWLQF